MTDKNIEAPIRTFIDDVASACRANGQPFGLRELLFCIRDIPYGRPTHPRDPLSVLADWKGTCSGKHLLAVRVLAALGVRSQLYCQSYRLDDAGDALPRQVTQSYVGHNIWDVHNYLELDTESGWLKVDVTWSQELAEAGFPTTLDWDGTADFRIAAPVGEIFIVSDPALLAESKEALLERLNTPIAREMRERYIAGLTAFAMQHSRATTRETGVAMTLQTIRSRSAGSRA